MDLFSAPCVMSRAWGMPSRDTFDCRPIGEFVARWMKDSSWSIDPFARNKRIASVTNDLNPATCAEFHMDAEDFLVKMRTGPKFDLAIMDPPYSPRQISECYKEAGLTVGMKETQNAVLYARVRAALASVLIPGAVVLSFGWNSSGMGKKYRATQLEILLVSHGGAHNDTICLAERMP